MFIRTLRASVPALAGVAALLSSSHALAAAQKYVFDKNHTNIFWHASHFGFSKPSGKFTEFDGSVTLDKDKPEHSSVEISIDTHSMLTGIPKFDEHLRSADFLDSEKYPKATFKSTRVDVKGDGKATVYGDFTLHGVTKEIPLDVTLNKAGVNPFTKQETAGFSARGTIARSAYGVNYGVPGISDEVDITIEAEAIVAEDKGK
ncbi:MAG: YceI family protein [Rickettsiales bacterium]